MSHVVISGSVFPTWRNTFIKADPRTHLPPKKHADNLHDQFILETYKRTQPSASTLVGRVDILRRIEECIQTEFGTRYMIGVFGSTAYGLDSDLTDLDITIVDTLNLEGGPFPGQKRTRRTPYSIDVVANCLRDAGFGILRVVRHARTPIVIAIDPSTKITLDVNTNSLGGLYNTLFLSAHARRSPHFFLPLANFLKLWAKRRVHPTSSDPSTKVTSYSLTIMLLAYLVSINAVDNLLVEPQGLKRRAPWVSKVLRTVDKKGNETLWTQEFSLGAGGRREETTNSRSPVNALYGFFAFLTDWDDAGVNGQIVSMRVGGVARGTRKGSDFERSDAYMVVQDPFITDRNVTGSLNAVTAKRFFQEARRARDLLQTGRPIQELLTP